MGKATKMCDFDPPEPPIERIIRGLKIAMDGANALDFTVYERECRKLRTKYETELAKATKNKAFVYFNFNENGVATEIEISGIFTNHVSSISVEKSRADIKRAVEEWAEMEAQKRGEKAKNDE